MLYLKEAYDHYMEKAAEFLQLIKGFSHEELQDRKRFASFVCLTSYSDFAFRWLDGKVSSVEDYYSKFSSEKLLEKIK